MTVRTPDFIIHECERLIKALPIEHREEADAICRKLHEQINVKEIIKLMEDIAKLEEAYVHPRMVPRLFKRSLVSVSLTKALEQYENQNEAKDMLDTVNKIANFEVNWCQDDETCNWDRTFYVVNSLKEWNRICARAEVLPNKGSIKIALQIKMPNKNKTAQKAWEKIDQSYTFAEHDYEIWFRLKPRALYYIYLPQYNTGATPSQPQR